MIGIYKITNKLNGKSYIGQSIHCGKRFDEHYKGSQLIDEIMQIEGIENFTCEILKEVIKEELSYWEDYYIIKYDTLIPNGYNKKYNCSKDIRNEILNKLKIESSQDVFIQQSKKSTSISTSLNEEDFSHAYFALPDPCKNDYEKERFSSMSDILYTYLYSISKHNPAKYTDGTYMEDWNYIYLDKYKDYPRYNASAVYKKLKISKSTYYRRMDTLKKYNLIYEATDGQGRRILKIPFIQSKMILPVKTCKFFTQGEGRTYTPDDIIKLIAILKILYYGQEKFFTMRQLRIQMGYSVTHNDKDEYIRNLLIILKGFNIIKWENKEVQLENNRKEIRYFITYFDDSYNSIMENFDKDKDYIDIVPMTEEEKQRIIPIK